MMHLLKGPALFWNPALSLLWGRAVRVRAEMGSKSMVYTYVYVGVCMCVGLGGFWDRDSTCKGHVLRSLFKEHRGGQCGGRGSPGRGTTIFRRSQTRQGLACSFSHTNTHVPLSHARSTTYFSCLAAYFDNLTFSVSDWMTSLRKSVREFSKTPNFYSHYKRNRCSVEKF